MAETAADAGRSAVATAVACLEAGIEHADPEVATRECVRLSEDGTILEVCDERVRLDEYDTIRLVGAGKGSTRVASAVVDVLASRIEDGLVITAATDDAEPVPEGSPPGDDEQTQADAIGSVAVRVGDHPLPSERGVTATDDLLALVEGADESTLVLVVVVGGASALLASPVEAVGLAGMRAVTRALLDAGASIDEVNAVRKHVSSVKGGRLAELAAPARVVTFAVSDVVGDDPSVIGSGPTVPDASTYREALDVLDRYDLEAASVRQHLRAGIAGDVPETPGPTATCFDGTSFHVVAGSRRAVAGAEAAAREHGFEPCVLSTTVRGESRDVGGVHAAVVREVATAGRPVEPPAVVVSTGETTVDVTGDGTGGPNQEFVLGAAHDLATGPVAGDRSDAVGGGEGSAGAWRERVAIAAVDTDGRDGSTDAAGAVLTGDALVDADARTAAADALRRNDAFGFLDEQGGLLRSGATGTNVNDLRVLVVPEPRPDE